jgi:hypothetical protein
MTAVTYTVSPTKATTARRDQGIVGKWRGGHYETDGVSMSCVKIKNPPYSEMDGRRELFEARTDRHRRSHRGYQAAALRLVQCTRTLSTDVRVPFGFLA